MNKRDKRLVESFSKRVDTALNEMDVVGNLTRAGANYLQDAAGEEINGDISKLADGQTYKNIGKKVVNDIGSTANHYFNMSPTGIIRNTIQDENGNFSFNPLRAGKKVMKGIPRALKLTDAALTGGRLKGAIDTVTGDDVDDPNEEKLTDKLSNLYDKVTKPKKTKKPVQQQPVQQQPVQQPQVQQPQQQQVQQPVQKQKVQQVQQ